MTRVLARSAVLGSIAGVSLLLLAWLSLAAMPVRADGGPHVSAVNSGASTLTADSCAGCHRAHTAQGAYLLAEPDEEALCVSCHGAAGTGATTDVENGVQYALGAGGLRGGTVAGALRAGGFVQARLDSSNPSRISFPRLSGAEIVTSFSSKVGVLAAGQPVTSAHLALTGSAAVERRVAWGNGATDSGAGPALELACASCHNPHGNGQYRILNPIPSDGTGPLVEAGTAANVTDAALPAGVGAAGVRNYTIQNGRTLADVEAAALGATAGDYWRRYLPWDGVPTWNGTGITPATGVAGDRPMYVVDSSTNLDGFRSQITVWCSTCHSRYNAGGTAPLTDSGDDIYRYRHGTQRQECTQCHVAHGTNALMPGAASGAFPYPGGAVSPSSRLLKIDNRGTCQACHDPTDTVPYTGVVQP